MRKKPVKTTFLFALMMLSLLSWTPSARAAIESTWSMWRPSEHVYINQHVENASTDAEASVGLGVFITEYASNSNSWPFDGRDGLIFKVVGTANTRKGITYSHYTVNNLIDWIDLSQLGSEYIVTTEDDGGRWISLPASLAVQFYGGPGSSSSGRYERVWASSNGFLSFDSTSNSSYPLSIPNSNKPNSLVAVYWSDLNPSGGWIKYYFNESTGLFVVEWYNVLDKNNGVRQTFEVIIWNSWDPYLGQRGQNRFAFLYQSVSWSGGAVAGIEDPEGYKGIQTGGQSGQTTYFQAEKESAEIRRLKITLEKDSSVDGEAEIVILTDTGVLKGVNLQLSNDPPDAIWYEDALCNTVTLLASSILSEVLGSAAAGIIFDVSLIGLEAVAAYARQFSPFAYEAPDVKNANTSENEAHVYAKAEGSWGWPVDSALGTQIYWVFTDDGSTDHSVKITVTLEYCYYNANHQSLSSEISTSVDLSVLVPQYLSISVNSGGTTTPAPGTYSYEYGSSVTVYANPDADFYVDHWELDGAYVSGGSLHYTVTMNSNHDLRIYFVYTGPPGGGGDGGNCPYVSTWDGSQYLLDNNLIPAAEHSNGTDVTDYYKLQQPLALENGKYLLKIWDPDKHSFLDQVKLFAVDHESDVNIAVSPYGEVLTYKNPTAAITAIDQDNQDVTSILSAVDENYFEGYAGDSILLDFGNLDVSKGAKLVLRTDALSDGEPRKCPYSIHVLNATGSWIDVASVIPRIYWSTDIVDLSAYLPDSNGDVKLKLYFTAYHKIDYVGMDGTKQGEFQLSYANFVTANHSQIGDVKELLQNSDNLHVELLPDEQVTLKFTLQPNAEEKRDFIIILEGHYFLIE